jgi:hypothetical protein
VANLAKFFHVTKSTIILASKRSYIPKSSSDGKIATYDSEIKMPKVRSAPTDPSLPVGRIIVIPVNLWSHKQGHASGPLMIDASGKTIVDPRKCNRCWKPGFHYTKFCSAYGVRRGFAKTGSNRNR